MMIIIINNNMFVFHIMMWNTSMKQESFASQHDDDVFTSSF